MSSQITRLNHVVKMLTTDNLTHQTVLQNPEEEGRREENNNGSFSGVLWCSMRWKVVQCLGLNHSAISNTETAAKAGVNSHQFKVTETDINWMSEIKNKNIAVEHRWRLNT